MQDKSARKQSRQVEVISLYWIRISFVVVEETRRDIRKPGHLLAARWPAIEFVALNHLDMALADQAFETTRRPTCTGLKS